MQVTREPDFGTPRQVDYDPPIVEGTAARQLRPRFDVDDFFGHQPTPTEHLPDPVPLLQNLTRCVIEILAGARELEQIARWVSDDRHYKTISGETANQSRTSQTPRRPAS